MRTTETCLSPTTEWRHFRILRRTIARGDYPVGYQSATWDGRDERGHAVASGVYFLRSSGQGADRTIKLVIAR